MDIASSAVGFKVCAITAGIKKYMPILEKKRKKQDKTVSLVKVKLNNTKILIYWTLNYSYITYIEFVSVNNVLRESKSKI